MSERISQASDLSDRSPAPLEPGPGGSLAIADCVRHEPEKTLLHEVIRAELVPFLARMRSEGAPGARLVAREVRSDLDCGVLTHPFLRFHWVAWRP